MSVLESNLPPPCVKEDPDSEPDDPLAEFIEKEEELDR